MKFTWPWLREHLETEAPLDALLERLTMLGLEVEGVEAGAGDLSAFRVVRVAGVRPHPNADRLRLCTVDTGSGEAEVVCGAPNVRPGMKAVFAAVGTTIPESGQVLKASVIRGVESAGMLCSARELRLGEDHDGIIELAPDAPVGASAAEVIRLEGPVIDVSVTPNRGDCLGVLGVARELAAAGLGRLRPRDFAPPPTADSTDLRIRRAFPDGRDDACPVFLGQVIRGVRNGPSPAWLRDRLKAVGLRPISALVDVTNYLTFDLGRPLHVFDAGKVRGDLVLRLAEPGETLTALDGATYTLDGGVTVIADDTGPISLGGVMGGASTGVDEGTTDVILEAALFDPIRTAATGRRLGIDSDARARFERGVDPGLVTPGAAHAVRLVLELCGGTAEPPVVAGAPPPPRRPIRLRPERLKRLGGVALEPDEIIRHLTALGFAVEAAGDGLAATPPSWRHDVTGETDLVEEVLRLHGYDRIPPVPVRRAEAVTVPALSGEQRRRGLLRRLLAERGLDEAVTWSFTTPELAGLFGGAALRLANPINAELSVLRPSVLANLLTAVGRNVDRGAESGALFEIGPRFAESGGGQEEAAAGLRFGHVTPRHWAGGRRPVDAFDAKADALALLGAAGVDVLKVTVDAEAPGHFHPGRSGRLKLGPKAVLAVFGELHPTALAVAGVEATVVGFEVAIDALPPAKPRAAKSRGAFAASPFPSVERDFAFVVAEDVSAERLLRAVKGADKHLIRKVAVFDVYQGPHLPAGTKSLALAVRLQAEDRTLTEADIEPVVRRVVTAAEKATGAVLRA